MNKTDDVMVDAPEPQIDLQELVNTLLKGEAGPRGQNAAGRLIGALMPILVEGVTLQTRLDQAGWGASWAAVGNQEGPDD